MHASRVTERNLYGYSRVCDTRSIYSGAEREIKIMQTIWGEERTKRRPDVEQVRKVCHFPFPPSYVQTLAHKN